jgi:hemolysin III
MKGTGMKLFIKSPKRDQSQGEEIANSISHGIGLIAAFGGAPFLIINAVQHGDAGFIVGSSIFSATIILLYLTSTLYHALPMGKAKSIFRIIEHSAIFLLIAGTYTPLTLGVLRGAFGWTLFGVVWGLAAIGVALKAFFKKPHPILSTAPYLLMGWLIVIAIDPLLARLPKSGILYLIAGGLFYTVGVFFFATGSRIRYGHLIWHLFVLAGTVCHYFTVLWFAHP